MIFLALLTLQPSPAQIARAMVQQLSLEEQVSLVHGSSDFGFAKLPKLKWDELLMTDGPQGVRGPTATAWSSGIAMAATWNPERIEEVGRALGREADASGHRVLLGPGVNIMRTPLGGRNFEYMGEDPYLAGKTAAGYVRGVQSQGVAACVKHFCLNEQEMWRTTIDVRCSERALNEIYAEPWRIAISESHPWSVMAAYNRINGPYCTESKPLLIDTLRGKWYFDGAVISDWGAWHDDKLSIEGGCDIEMPSGADAARDARIAARVRRGEISAQALEDRATMSYLLSMRLRGGRSEAAEIATPRHAELARKLATESMVLLRNQNGLLPLDATRLKRIAVIGPNADFLHTMKAGGLERAGGSGAVLPAYEITPLMGLRERLGGKVQIEFVPGYEFEAGYPPVPASALPGGLVGEEFSGPSFAGTERARKDATLDVRWKSGEPLVSIRWKGTLVAPETADYTLALSSDDGSRLALDGKLLIDNWGDHDTKTVTVRVRLVAGERHALAIEYANTGGKGDIALGWRKKSGVDFANVAKAARNADVAIVFAGTNHSYDREALGWGDVPHADKPDLELIGPQARLIKAVATANPRTVVVLINGAPVSVEGWHDKVGSILEAWYPGQESGRAIADVLFGDAEPGGRLPCTFGKRLEDWPCHRMGTRVYPGTGNNGHVDYDDGIWVGYRGFDHFGTAPRYPFGFGLGYGKFEISKPALTVNGLLYSLRTVVRNVGSRTGSEVLQVYVEPSGDRDRPVRELKAFRKVSIPPGASETVDIRLLRGDFARYDEKAHDWIVPAGKYSIAIGRSSREILYRIPVTIDAPSKR